MRTLSRRFTRPSPLALSAFVVAATSGAAWAQGTRVAFSVDYRSGHVGLANCATPAPLTDGDVLTACTPGGVPAFGPLPAPRIAIPGGGGVGTLGLPMYPGCVGHPAGTPCGIDVDALSTGVDFPVTPTRMLAGTYVFSVDRCSLGLLAPLAPNVTSEGPVGDAPADLFQDLGLPPGPLPPGPAVGNSGIVDGNGLPSGTGAVYPGLGLFEPGAVLMPFYDDLDALDIDPAPVTAAGGGAVYFSLDAGFPDACTGLPNSNSGPANGFPGAAVLVSNLTGAPPIVYAPPGLLGLNLLGPGTDDLDALALAENGLPGYQPSAVPFDWLPNTAGVVPTDMLLFSVRRGSAVIGMLDSNFGIPIQPGDILTTPRAGGLSPFPGIFIAAEWLGLRTFRMGNFADDLNALDTVYKPQTALPYCFGTAAACPCGNAGAAGNGCANSLFAAGAHLNAIGTASVTADTVTITCTNMPNSFSLMYQGTAQANAVFGDGLRCVAGLVRRFPVRANVANSNFYPNPAFVDPPLSVMGGIPAAGGTRFYQSWYRDAMPFCTPFTFNLSNAVAIVWTP